MAFLPCLALITERRAVSLWRNDESLFGLDTMQFFV